MTESDFVRQVLTTLRGNPNTVVFKHNDNFTVGIPDISATHNGLTTWLEAKMVAGDESPVKRVSHDQLQLRTMDRLAKKGRAAYIIWDHGHLTIWPPTFLVRRIVLEKNFIWTQADYDARPDLYDKDQLIYDLVRNRWHWPIWFPDCDLNHVRALVER